MNEPTVPLVFDKPFTQQESVPEIGIARAVEIMRSGRLHRYNTLAGEPSEVAALEREFADWQGARYCVALTSGGQAIQAALRAAGVKPGDAVLANAYTLAPVPGAIHAAGGHPVFVEINRDWLTDLDDLRQKALASGARFLLLSHMRGHICDMGAVVELCREFGITLIEDCAHTMGARWNGRRSGNFGAIACFSTQTYKHMNSGEGGFLTTDDPEIAARAVILSGSYMLYDRHGARPPDEVFERVKLETPNCSARLDNLRAALIRAQLPLIDDNIRRWNARYLALEQALRDAPGIAVVARDGREEIVGSSFQFHLEGRAALDPPQFVARCAARGVDVKWFGAAAPSAFTSRYDSWRYVDEIQTLPQTLRTLSTTCDIRVPLTFSEQDCRIVAAIIRAEAVPAGG